MVTQVTTAMCNGSYGNIEFILSPFSSGVTQTAAIACEDYNRILISGGAASEAVFSCLSSNINSDGCSGKVIGQRRFDNLFGVINLSSQYMEPVVLLTKLNGANSIAFFHGTGLFQTTMCEQARSEAIRQGFDTVYDLYSLDGTDSGFDTLFGDLETNKPDVVIGCTLNTNCQSFVNKAYDRNYIPNFLALSVCVGSSSVEANLGEKFRYIAGPVQWDKRCLDVDCFETSDDAIVHYFNQTNGVTAPEEFNTRYYNYSGIEPSYQAAGSMATLYTLAYAVQRAGSNATGLVRVAMDDITQPSYYGRIEGSRLGANEDKQMIILQYDENQVSQIVSPLSTDTLSVIYPIPTWEERSYDQKLYDRASEKFLIAMVCITTFMLVTLAGILVANRAHPAVKASSILFVLISIVGLEIVNLSLVTWPIENTKMTCLLRPWLATLGSTLFLAPIMAKMYRIKTIFDNIRKPFKISNLKLDDFTLLKYVGYAIVVPLVILILWQVIAPLEAEVEVTDRYRPSTNLTVCSTDSRMFGIVIVVYLFVLMCGLIVLSFQTRKSWSKFKESQQMAFALYGFILAALVAVILNTTGNNTRDYLLNTRVAFVTVAIWIWCAALYGPKIVRIWYEAPSNTDETVMVSNADLGAQGGHVQMQAPARARETKEVAAHAGDGVRGFQDEVERLEQRLKQALEDKAKAEAKAKKLEDRVFGLMNEKIEALEAKA